MEVNVTKVSSHKYFSPTKALHINIKNYRGERIKLIRIFKEKTERMWCIIEARDRFF
jgi:hypothetical protein